jgi:hypothetical protein
MIFLRGNADFLEFLNNGPQTAFHFGICHVGVAVVQKSEAAVRRKKPYSPPEVRKLTREQAALILLGQAWDGNENAKELLWCCADALFPAPPKSNATPKSV